MLFRRGLASENHAVQKLVLFSILEGDLYGHRHARVTDDVIFGSEASVLHTSLGLWLYRQVTDDDDDSEVALLLRSLGAPLRPVSREMEEDPEEHMWSMDVSGSQCDTGKTRQDLRQRYADRITIDEDQLRQALPDSLVRPAP